MPGLSCPQCRSALLDPMRHDGVEIDACVRCGGLWFDRRELDHVVRAYDADFPRADGLFETLGEKRGDTSMHCPRCGGVLCAHCFAAGSALVLDVCGQCQGIWLQHGELAHAQADHHVPGALERIDRGRTARTWLFQFFSGLPVEFNIRPRRFPLVTTAIIAVNVLIFLVLRLSPSVDVLVSRLALFPAQRGEPHWFVTLLTHQFLHASLVHLAGNMYFAYILGDNLEDVFGPWRFLALYLACGIVGGVAQSFFSGNPNLPCIGASGAVAGLFGAFLMIFRRAKLTFMFVIFQAKLSVYWYAAIWIAFNLSGIVFRSQNVAWFAHLAGFATGTLVARRAYERILDNQPLLRLLNARPTSS